MRMPEFLPARRRAAADAFTLIELMVVIGVLAIIMAISIPSYLRSKMVGNETAAVATLRTFVTLEATWRQNDVDRNNLGDYWTADVSGFYRIEASPAGSARSVAQVDAAICSADDNKLGAGAAIAGAVLDSGVPAANLLAFAQNGAKSGYLFRAMVNDLSTAPVSVYAADPAGNGQLWTNNALFGFQARPEKYNSTGLNTIVVNQAGVIYKRDFGDNNSANANFWPPANPSTTGWGPIQ